MPKLKTKSSVKKRFKITATGKVMAGPVVRGVKALLSREVGAEASTLLPKTKEAA